MTATIQVPPARRRLDVLRWGFCFALALSFHAAGVAALFRLQLLSLAALVWQLDALRARCRHAPAVARGSAPRLAVRDGLALRHLLVAVHLDAHLRRPAGAAGRGGGVRAGGRAVLYYALGCALFVALRRRARCARRPSSPRCGPWPNCCAAAGSPAFRGARAAMRTSKGRWRSMRPGSASTGSARSRPASRHWGPLAFRMRAAAFALPVGLALVCSACRR